MASNRPIVTFTTDFGTTDFYVGAMKGALLGVCPDALPVDITHAVPRHDILFGSIMLERAVQAFPVGTVHVAVVDPGVGSDRRILIAKLNGQIIVAPDNGLVTWTHHRVGLDELFELTWKPATPTSHVFHGRDWMAPAAGRLANGEPPATLGRPVRDPVLLNIAPAQSPAEAVVLHVDHFGNVTTNVPAPLITPGTGVEVGPGERLPIRQTYSDVGEGESLALIGSSGLLEIAVRNGSAADRFGLRPQRPVRVVQRD